MYGKLVTGAIFTLLLASPAMAATPALAASSHTQAASHTSSSMNKETVHHVRGKKVSMISSGHSEVHALNALQAAGYRRLKNLHAKGANFVGTAQKAGKSYDVTVTPSGSIKATIA
ncbi:MAG TPA: hypothetical protein VN670_11595 [Acidobacteriaceae bacterium]|nr:hypothetical protein [Acidobacteriaceae bacterium]